MPVPPADSVYLLVATLCGGAATKLIDYAFGARKTTSDIQLAERKQEADADATMRAELRAEALRHREALKQAEDERDEWRNKYYELNETSPTGKHPVVDIKTTASLLSEIEHLRDQVVQLQRSNENLTARIRAQNK